MVVALILALAGPQDVSPADRKKLEAARAAVEKSPDDAKANLDLGRMLCLFMGEWAEGLPHLAKGGDKTFAPIAEKDLAPRATVEDSLAMADAWLKLEKVQKQYAAQLRERALFHYAEAWPKMDPGASREAMRARVKALQVKGPESKGLGAYPVVGWGMAPSVLKSGLDREYARSGQWSLKVIPADPKNQGFPIWLSSDALPCKPGAKVVFSCWVLSLGGEGHQDEMRVKFRNATQSAAEHLALIPMRINSDLPIWTKVQHEATAPEGTINVEFSYKRGAAVTAPAFVDDVSLKVDGREILKNGGFELK